MNRRMMVGRSGPGCHRRRWSTRGRRCEDRGHRRASERGPGRGFDRSGASFVIRGTLVSGTPGRASPGRLARIIRMNVIVVVCNSVHLGFLGAYGNAWIETPNLDRLAAEGVVFDHHFPENLTTLPTRRTWWTGRYGFADADQGWTALRADELILPDMLWNKGVRTALISDVPLLREAGMGYGRGFD